MTPAKPPSDRCHLCGNTREWHRNPGKSGVHRFAEPPSVHKRGPHEFVPEPPSDEERARAKDFCSRYVVKAFDRHPFMCETCEALTALLRQVRAEASQEKDAEIGRLQGQLDVMGGDIADGYLKRAEAAEAERDALREEKRKLSIAIARFVRRNSLRPDEPLMDENEVGRIVNAVLREDEQERAALREENTRLRGALGDILEDAGDGGTINRGLNSVQQAEALLARAKEQSR